jgi:hypothetical protein
MSNAQQPLAAEHNGETYLSPAAVLLLSADAGYCDPDCTPEGKAKGRAMVRAILAAAQANGYPYAPQLQVLLVAGEGRNPKVLGMARDACSMVPSERMVQVVVGTLSGGKAE